MLNAAAIADLRKKLRGTLLTPDAPGYDATRKVFNAMVDKRPALIALCADASDVVAGVNFARDHGVLLWCAAADTISPARPSAKAA